MWRRERIPLDEGIRIPSEHGRISKSMNWGI